MQQDRDVTCIRDERHAVEEDSIDVHTRTCGILVIAHERCQLSWKVRVGELVEWPCIFERQQRTSEVAPVLSLSCGPATAARSKDDMRFGRDSGESSPGDGLSLVRRCRAPETCQQVLRGSFARGCIASEAALLGVVVGCGRETEASVKDESDVVAFDSGEVLKHGMEGAIGNTRVRLPFRKLRIVVVSA